MTAVVRPVLRYHGGKFRLGPWVLKHFPAHQVYVEPFGGAASVLMQKPRSHGEVYNDLDDDIVNVFRILRDPVQCAQLERALQLTPCSRVEFYQAFLSCDDPIERARRTFIRAEMGFGSAGATKMTTGFRIDTKRNYGTSMALWAEIPAKLAAFCQRLQGVLIENRPALRVIADHDTPETLFYVDPPYVHGARVFRKGGYYRHEMTDEQHIELLQALRQVKGMVVLSGYRNPLYDEHLGDWAQSETDARIAAGRGTVLRREVLWINAQASNALAGVQMRLSA